MASAKTPLVGSARPGRADQVVMGQICRTGRNAMASKVARARDNYWPDFPDPHRVQRRISEVPDPHCNIDPFFDHSYVAIDQQQMDIKPGVVGQQIGNHRHHVQPAERNRSGNMQLSARLGPGPAQCAFGVGQFLEQSLCARQQRCALSGQRDCAGGAMQQPKPKVRFKRSDSARYRLR
jgi:hypothetical protein